MPPLTDKPLGDLSLAELRAKVDGMRARVLQELREVEELEKQLADMMGQQYRRFKKASRPRRAPADAAPAVQDAVALVAEVFRVEEAGIFSSSRRASLAWPRHIAMFLVRQHNPMSLAQIGLEFGNRDHSTVLHACRKVEDRAEIDPLFAEELAGLAAALRRRVSGQVAESA